MARYIDAEQFRGKHEVAEVNGKLSSVILYADIVYAPTADVAPKSEVAREIFEEIGKILYKHTNIAIKEKSTTCELAIDYLGEDIAELKKKYTEGKNNDRP